MKVVSLINMKGGVAKTTLAINLADCLAKRHQASVLLIDVDPQFNATQCLMSPDEYMAHRAEEKDTIISVFDRSHRAVASTVDTPTVDPPIPIEDIEVVKIEGEFGLLPGSLELFKLEMAAGQGRENRLKNYIKKLRQLERYDYIVIDTPPTPSAWMTSALIASDYYLIPVKADPISLTGIDLLKSIIEEKRDNFDLKIKCIGLVLTVTEPGTIVYRRAQKSLEDDDYWCKYLYQNDLPKRTEIARNQLDRCQILAGNDADSKRAITAITTEFLNRVQSDEN